MKQPPCSSAPIKPSRRNALLALGAIAASCVAPGARAQRRDTRGAVLMVVQLNGPNIAVDQQIAAHLQARGYTVRLVNQDFDPALAHDARLVVISSTVSAKDVPAGWRTAPVPLFTWENDLLDDLAMSGKRHDTDFGEVGKERYLWLVNAPHPVSAGLPAGVANVFRKQAPMSWGKPGLGASIIATIYGQPEKAAIFTYEKGATMDYEALAPARRVMFFMDNDSFPNLSESGIRLFDAAIDWATA
ncbi:hypothetical protein [Paraburkholderia sp.]|uniref:hypothetical protein n=1 Tax=Paraburkholderia sp. TaxID=1926495 RepID=UPI0039E4F27F